MLKVTARKDEFIDRSIDIGDDASTHLKGGHLGWQLKQGGFMFKKGLVAVPAICVFVLCCGFDLRVVGSRTQDLQTVNIRVEMV